MEVYSVRTLIMCYSAYTLKTEGSISIMKNISEANIESFKEYLLAKGLSKNTQIAYLRAIQNYKTLDYKANSNTLDYDRVTSNALDCKAKINTVGYKGNSSTSDYMANNNALDDKANSNTLNYKIKSNASDYEAKNNTENYKTNNSTLNYKVKSNSLDYKVRSNSLNSIRLSEYREYIIKKYKPRTVNQIICAINSYLEFIKADIPKLKQVRVSQTSYLENVISEADYIYLLGKLKADGYELFYLIIKLMATTGMRVSEVRLVSCEDIRMGYSDVVSKGNRLRRVWIPNIIRNEILAYLNTTKRSRGYVFISSRGNVITDSGIRTQLKYFASKYNIRPEVMHPHSFRHFFAKQFLKHCSDLAMLADILGHSNIETTRIYLRNTQEEQRNIINNIVNW